MGTSVPNGRRGVQAWLVAAVAAASAVVAVGDLHRHHTGDSIVFVLASLYKWTPYFWESDRTGLLVPLIAAPVRDPFANLIVQTGLTAFFGLSVFVLLPRYLHPAGPWELAAVFGLGSFLALAPSHLQFECLAEQQQYGVALALGLAGLILADPRRDGPVGLGRFGAALALMCLAHWVNLGAIAMLGLLPVFRFVAHRLAGSPAGSVTYWWRAATRELALPLWLLVAGFIAGLLMMDLSDFHDTTTRQSEAGTWVEAWQTLGENFLRELSWPLAAWVAVALGVSWTTVARFQGGERRLGALLAAVPIAAATAYWLFVGTRDWVGRGSFMPRYCTPCVFFLTAGSAVAVASALSAWRPTWAGGRVRVVLPAVVGVAIVSHGWPSLDKARTYIDEAMGGATRQVVEARCTHVAGNYWKVWPAVYHANLVLHERGEGRVVWGVTYRCGPTLPEWSRPAGDETRVALLPPLGDEAGYLRLASVAPLVDVEPVDGIRIAVPVETRGGGR